MKGKIIGIVGILLLATLLFGCIESKIDSNGRNITEFCEWKYGENLTGNDAVSCWHIENGESHRTTFVLNNGNWIQYIKDGYVK